MVRWKEIALDRLADIYVAAPTPAARDAIARCVERINARLAVDPGASAKTAAPAGGCGSLRRSWLCTTCRPAVARS